MIYIHTELVNKDTSINSNTVEKFVKKVMSDHDIQVGEVACIFGTDEMLRNLNLRFFGKDEFTDVIAFRLDTAAPPESLEKNETFEGEIYISVNQAKTNAHRYRVCLANELTRLIFHGTLHLLGYDDNNIRNRTQMQLLENQYLAQVTVDDLLTS